MPLTVLGMNTWKEFLSNTIGVAPLRTVLKSRGNQVLARMERLLKHPPSRRMPWMQLHGDSNISKTMLVEKFVLYNPNICNEINEVEVRKTVHLQMPANPYDKLYAQIIY